MVTTLHFHIFSGLPTLESFYITDLKVQVVDHAKYSLLP